MRRLWFKKEMKDAILSGKKTATTRTHRLIQGGTYLAVSGSRFNAIPFAMLKITQVEERHFDSVLRYCFKEEGFDSSAQMEKWCEDNGLDYARALSVFFHSFTVKPI